MHKRLYLSPASAVLAERDPRGRLAILKHADFADAEVLSEIGPVLAEWGGPRARLPVRDIVVDDHWCRFFMVKPPANADRPGDLAFAAANRFESLYDERPADWVIQGDWKAGRSFVACALHRPLLVALDGSCVSRVREVVPQTIDYCNRYLRRQPLRQWLLTASAARIAVTVFEKRTITDIHQVPIADEFWDAPENFLAFIERECLRLHRSPPDELVCCGYVPASWIPPNMNGVHILVHREAVLHDARSHAQDVAGYGPH